LLGLSIGGYFAASQAGGLSRAPSWLQLPALIQSRVEVRSAQPTVESGRSAEALIVASGYLESRRQARIGARAPGRIEVVHVEEGSLVTKDQVLAVLEHADLDASLAASRASLAGAQAQAVAQEITIAQAKRDYDRALKLWNSKSLSESEYDKKLFDYESAQARLESLKAEVKLAEARIAESEQLRENMFVRAPFDGTVISKDSEVGESIMPGGMGEASGRGSVVTIADLLHLEVDCDVKEDFISRVFEGQAAEIAVDAVPDRRYQGRVRKIIPMGDRARATIKVKVEVGDADGRLFPEMSSTVYFLPAESGGSSRPPADAPRMFVPSTAVQSASDNPFVWVVDDSNRAQKRSIQLGETRDGRSEVLSGLDAADRLVVDPPDLTAGQLVKTLAN
jgi:RND family efflux transporter MFP subunit